MFFAYSGHFHKIFLVIMIDVLFSELLIFLKFSLKLVLNCFRYSKFVVFLINSVFHPQSLETLLLQLVLNLLFPKALSLLFLIKNLQYVFFYHMHIYTQMTEIDG